MTVISLPGRRDTFLSNLCEGCEGAGEQEDILYSRCSNVTKNGLTSVYSCLTTWGKYEDFIMNQTKIFKVMLISNW